MKFVRGQVIFVLAFSALAVVDFLAVRNVWVTDGIIGASIKSFIAVFAFKNTVFAFFV